VKTICYYILYKQFGGLSHVKALFTLEAFYCNFGNLISALIGGLCWTMASLSDIICITVWTTNIIDCTDHCLLTTKGLTDDFEFRGLNKIVIYWNL